MNNRGAEAVITAQHYLPCYEGQKKCEAPVLLTCEPREGPLHR